MRHHIITVFVSCLVLLSLMITGCAGIRNKKHDTAQSALNSVDQIDSFNPEVASRQGLEVVNSNPYSRSFSNRSLTASQNSVGTANLRPTPTSSGPAS
jgi:hypothetical protein